MMTGLVSVTSWFVVCHVTSGIECDFLCQLRVCQSHASRQPDAESYFSHHLITVWLFPWVVYVCV